jgi:hypothetical protein
MRVGEDVSKNYELEKSKSGPLRADVGLWTIPTINLLAMCIGNLVLLLSLSACINFGWKFVTSVVCGMRI